MFWGTDEWASMLEYYRNYMYKMSPEHDDADE